MKEKIKDRFYIFLALTGLILGSLKAISYTAEKIIHYPDVLKSIEKAWQWAEEQVNQYKNGYWIGYSFERLMSENSFIRYSCDQDMDKPSIRDLLDQQKMKHQSIESKELTVQEAAQKALKKQDAADKKVMKEIAVLFSFNSGKPEIKKVNKIGISNLSEHFDFENKPVIWLGKSEIGESVSFLKKSYGLVEDDESKKEIITSIALHQYNPMVIDFLSKVSKDEDNPELRKNAVFWLSQQESDKVLPQIKDLIENDPSIEVRKHAVFALSQVQSEKTIDILIDLAKNAKISDVRKQAIFWLSQKACKQAAEALNDLVYDGELIEIQKQAVFALSQLNDGEGISNLIKIAKNHPSIEIRKNAIFWLGQSKDDRALDAIISIVRQE